MKEELTSLMEDIARLAAQAAAALARGDAEEAIRAQREADIAWQRARRLGQQRGRRPTLSKAPSVRERAVATVSELGVPSSPKLIAAYAEALTGEAFDLRAIASIRRDEQRSWTSGSKRETYLVPALEGPWFVGARGRFALSHWPLWKRIIGPLSPRADHLTIGLHLCDRMDSLGRSDPTAARLAGLLADYARSIPGALGDAWETGENVDPTRIRSAAATELNMIRVEDENWRKREAERATRNLDDVQQLWGGTVPQVISSKPG